jgi:hypothetical protein
MSFSFCGGPVMSDFEIREVAEEIYESFLETVRHSVFQSMVWLNIVKRVYKVEIRLLGYYRDDVLCAVTPLMKRRVGPVHIWGAPLRKCATPPTTPYCAPSNLGYELAPVLHQWIRSRHIRYMQLALPVSSVFNITDGKIEPLDNLELNLNQPLESIWKSISQRTSVRKAVRSGVRLCWRFDPDLLETHQLLLRDTYGRQGASEKANFPRELYSQLLNERQSVGLRVLCATHQGKVIGTAWILVDGEKCYYWDAATLNEARDLNANHLLVWTLIRWAHRKGFSTFDFVGPSSGGRGVSRPGIGRFKLSMGAHAVDYHLLYWYSPLMRAALLGYRKLNRLRNLKIRKPRKSPLH